MSEIILDFEKPIEQMSARQAELEAALSSNPEIASELKELKTRIEETKALYLGLSGKDLYGFCGNARGSAFCR